MPSLPVPSMFDETAPPRCDGIPTYEPGPGVMFDVPLFALILRVDVAEHAVLDDEGLSEVRLDFRIANLLRYADFVVAEA